jgi:hypothetical protein
MVQFRDWIPGLSSSGGLENMSAEEIDLEKRDLEAELNIKENSLEKLNNEFRQKLKEAAEAPATQRDRLKLKAKQKKKEYEQQKAEYQSMLQEFMALQTVENAKKRLDRQSESSLRNMDKSEINDFKQQIKSDIIDENQDLRNIQQLEETVDQTLTALTEDLGQTQEDEQLDQLIDEIGEGKQDLEDVDIEETFEEGTEEQISTEEEDLLDEL